MRGGIANTRGTVGTGLGKGVDPPVIRGARCRSAGAGRLPCEWQRPLELQATPPRHAVPGGRAAAAHRLRPNRGARPRAALRRLRGTRISLPRRLAPVAGARSLAPSRTSQLLYQLHVVPIDTAALTDTCQSRRARKFALARVAWHMVHCRRRRTRAGGPRRAGRAIAACPDDALRRDRRQRAGFRARAGRGD